jgi:uncharacterized membrane protein
MSELIVIGYDDHTAAQSAYHTVLQLAADHVLSLDGLAIVDVDAEGRTHVETPEKIVGVSAASGAMWGMLIGLLFFVPFVGMALGGAMGALMGRAGRSGVDETFRGQVQDLLRPGHSAIVLMASELTEDRFAAAMAPYGGTVLKTSLSEDDERELAHEISGEPT